MRAVLEWPQSHATSKTINMIRNKYEPQQKCRLGTVSKKLLGGLNRFYGYRTSPSASIMAQNIPGMIAEMMKPTLQIQSNGHAPLIPLLPPPAYRGMVGAVMWYFSKIRTKLINVHCLEIQMTLHIPSQSHCYHKKWTSEIIAVVTLKKNWVKGYIVFVFSFVRSYVCSLVCSFVCSFFCYFVLPSRSWNYFKVLC